MPIAQGLGRIYPLSFATRARPAPEDVARPWRRHHRGSRQRWRRYEALAAVGVGDERGGGTVVAGCRRQFKPAAGGGTGWIVGIDIAPGERAMQGHHRLPRLDRQVGQMVGRFGKQSLPLFDTQREPFDVVDAALWKRARRLDEAMLVP